MSRAAPHSRTADPISSYIAGEEMQASGAAESQAGLVLDLVARYPGSTSRELAALGEVDRYTPSRRLPELEREGKVARAGMRKCSIGRRLSATWILAGNRQGKLL